MASDSKPILPGSTIGVLGSGQLGRMFAIAARQMGYRVHTLSPDTDTPTGQVADVEVVAEYEDLDAVAEFARAVDVVTYEFENIPIATARCAAEHAIVRPDGQVLHTTQHRLREKDFLAKHGFPVTRYRAVRSREQMEAAFRDLGPGVLKTASFGYDGKGQSKINLTTDLAGVGGDVERIYEQLVDFDREVSVVAARGVDGGFAHWGVVENRHENHILDLTIAPADVSPAIAKEAVEVARGVLDSLGVVGVLCVEFFLTESGKILINELAPRPHNSGHFSIDACVTSQFEQQLRAVCGLPLGSTRQHRPAVMAQLLGDLWQDGEPRWDRAVAIDGVKLHLYGKHEAKPGRKMGHLTATGETIAEAEQKVLAAREALTSFAAQ
jgi:5-(carboxyamino)imidazole ribonucleotide synthase